MSDPKPLTLDELEKLLQHDDEVVIEIQPNGQLRQHDGRMPPKVLTMRENLGGEY